MPLLPIEQQVTFLYTADLETTAAFYEGVLGLELALDQGACRIYRTGGDSFLGFCQRIDANREHLDVIVTLVTRDVDGWYATLVSHGVTFEKPPALNPKFNIYHCFLRDPNGYLIEIQRFDDPRWPAVSSSSSARSV